MKHRTRWTVLGLIVATCATGCGTTNPTGPSFARTEPAMDPTVMTMPISEDPGFVEEGTGTFAPDAEINRRKSNNGNAYGHDNDGNHYGLDASTMPIAEDPGIVEEGTGTFAPEAAPVERGGARKKAKKDNPGNHYGW